MNLIDFQENFSCRNGYARTSLYLFAVIALLGLFGIASPTASASPSPSPTSLSLLPPSCNTWEFEYSVGLGSQAYVTITPYDALTQFCPGAHIGASLNIEGNRLSIWLDGTCNLEDVSAGNLALIQVFIEGSSEPTYTYLMKDGGGVVLVVLTED